MTVSGEGLTRRTEAREPSVTHCCVIGTRDEVSVAHRQRQHRLQVALQHLRHHVLIRICLPCSVVACACSNTQMGCSQGTAGRVHCPTLEHSRVSRSHTRMVLSQEPENTCRSPTASTRTLSSCPSSVFMHCRVCESHTCGRCRNTLLQTNDDKMLLAACREEQQLRVKTGALVLVPCMHDHKVLTLMVVSSEPENTFVGLADSARTAPL